VFIVEPRQVLRELLAIVLDQRGYLVVGTRDDGADLLDALAVCRPNVLILALDLPTTPALDVCRAVLDRYPEIQVLAVDESFHAARVFASVLAGVRGYTSRHWPLQRLLDNLETLARGDSLVAAEARDIAQVWQRLGAALADQPETPLAMLAPREREVALLVARGMTNRQIAQQLGVSPNTVRNTLIRVMNKFGANSRAQVAATIARFLVGS